MCFPIVVIDGGSAPGEKRMNLTQSLQGNKIII